MAGALVLMLCIIVLVAYRLLHTTEGPTLLTVNGTHCSAETLDQRESVILDAIPDSIAV
ncbi:MAG: hypothetical protein ACXVIS_10840 [Halobacteriota archaeon]